MPSESVLFLLHTEAGDEVVKKGNGKGEGNAIRGKRIAKQKAERHEGMHVLQQTDVMTHFLSCFDFAFLFCSGSTNADVDLRPMYTHKRHP